jgi:hypothetical protein
LQLSLNKDPVSICRTWGDFGAGGEAGLHLQSLDPGMVAKTLRGSRCSDEPRPHARLRFFLGHLGHKLSGFEIAASFYFKEVATGENYRFAGGDGGLK